MINHALLGQFIEELYATETLAQRFAVYQKYILALGFNGATYTFVPTILKDLKLSFLPVFIHTDFYPIDFLEHYQQQQLNKHDFTIRKALANDLPRCMDWRAYEKAGLVSVQEAAVIILAREDYGINNAVTIPIGRETGIGSVSLITHEPDGLFQTLLKDHLETLLHCTRLFHEANTVNHELPLVFMKPLLDSLKPKEILVLHHLASGQPLKTISNGISYRYAANVLDDLRARMGGITKDKLMYLVGHLHLLDVVK